jgi:signal peptidase II
MTRKKQAWLVAGIVLLAIVLDQTSKLGVKLYLEEPIEVFSWFHITHVENPGSAFGVEWFDKLFLTLFRIVAVTVLGWYTSVLINKQQVRTGFLVTVAMVMAGAMGNIIDCVFYGKIFGEARWFYGNVVDMLYFPIIHNSAGECIFFPFVFNVADSFITVAVFLIILFYRKDLDESLNKIFAKKKKEVE